MFITTIGNSKTTYKKRKHINLIICKNKRMKQTAIIFILFIVGSLAISNGRNKHESRATGK
jgi:hypothetical protein